MFGSCMKFHYFDQFQQSSNNFHINKTSVRVKNYLYRKIVSSVEMNSNSFPHLIQLSSTNLLLHGSKLSKEQLINLLSMLALSFSIWINSFNRECCTATARKSSGKTMQLSLSSLTDGFCKVSGSPARWNHSQPGNYSPGQTGQTKKTE